MSVKSIFQCILSPDIYFVQKYLDLDRDLDGVYVVWPNICIINSFSIRN